LEPRKVAEIRKIREIRTQRLSLIFISPPKDRRLSIQCNCGFVQLPATEWRPKIAHGETMGGPSKTIPSPGSGGRKSSAGNSFAPSGAGMAGALPPTVSPWAIIATPPALGIGGRTRAGSTRNVRENERTSPSADHLTPLAFLDREIFRIQFAPPVRVSNFVNSVGNPIIRELLQPKLSHRLATGFGLRRPK
jgi:hypothetical protein